jgi:hypothetical protein
MAHMANSTKQRMESLGIGPTEISSGCESPLSTGEDLEVSPVSRAANAPPNKGVQATALTLRFIAAPDARRSAACSRYCVFVRVML